jgi:hypothetical protein
VFGHFILTITSTTSRCYTELASHKSEQLWISRIWDGKKKAHVHLGGFEREKDAALAWDEAARRLRGDATKLNFPGDGT